MKNYIFITFFSFAFSVSVTFNVDMQEQFVFENGVHLAGSDALTETFFGTVDGVEISPWTPEEAPMFDDDYDGIYSITVELIQNTSYIYKFVNGYEYELQGGTDRVLETGVDDIILDVACYNKEDDTCEEIDNSLVEIIFTVDMQEVELSGNEVFILGTNIDDYTNFGYYIDTLEPIPIYDPSALSLVETDENIYSISIYVNPGIKYQYRFAYGNEIEDEIGFRELFDVSEVLGYNLDEVCYNSEEDCPEFSTLIDKLIFKADLSNAISNNGFGLEDMLVIKWGFGETQAVEKQDTLNLQAFTQDYKVSIDDVMISEEKGLYYQYYKILNDSEDSREIFFNFEYEGSTSTPELAERRYFSFDNISDFSEVTILDDVDSNVDQRRMPIFLNSDPIGEEVEVTWTIDLSPAYYQILSGDILYDIQGEVSVDNVDSLYAWGVWINGPASIPANGVDWTQWGLTLQNTSSKKMWDDGTHGDSVADDHIYTIKLTYDEETPVGQECKFGIKGEDNEASYGLNHYEYIDIINPNIHIYWGSINPVLYDAWDYDLNQPIENSCTLMDINADGTVNVVDIVAVVNIILGALNPSEEQSCAADVNQDGTINVVDIVSIVNSILN